MMQRTRRLPVFCCAIGTSMLLLPTMILKNSSPSVPSLSSSFHHKPAANYNSVLLVHVGIDAVDDTNAAVVASIVPYTDGITMVLDNSDESFGDKDDAFDFVVMEPEPVLFVLSVGPGVATTATVTAATTTTNSSAQETDKASRDMIATTATTSSSGVPETKTTNTTAFGDSFVFPPKPNTAFGDFLVFWTKLFFNIFCELIDATISLYILPFIFFLRIDFLFPIFVIIYKLFLFVKRNYDEWEREHREEFREAEEANRAAAEAEAQRIVLVVVFLQDNYGVLWLLVASLFFSRRAQTAV